MLILGVEFGLMLILGGATVYRCDIAASERRL
jgi:hypothetical protein